MEITLTTVFLTVLAMYWSMSAEFSELRGKWMKSIIYTIVATITAIFALISIFFH